MLEEDTVSPELQSKKKASKAKCAEAVDATSNSSTADTEMIRAKSGSTETDPVSGTEVQSADDAHKSSLLSRAKEVLESSAEPQNDPAGCQDLVAASEIIAAVAAIPNVTPETLSIGRATLEPYGEESLSAPQGGTPGHQDLVATSEVTEQDAAVAAIPNATPETASTSRATLEPCGEKSLSVPQGGAPDHQDSEITEDDAAVAAIQNPMTTTALQSLLDGEIPTSFQDCHNMGLFAEEQVPATNECHSFPHQPQLEDALHTPQVLPVESLTQCSSHIRGNAPLAPQLQAFEVPYAHVSRQPSAPQNQHFEQGDAQMYNPPPVTVEQPAYSTAWKHQAPLAQAYPGLEVQPSTPQNQHPEHNDVQTDNPLPVTAEQPTLQHAPYLPNHQDGTGSLLTMVKRSILCSVCKMIFNRAVICREYLIQLNRPVQCVCGCVICTLCYREQGGCRMHNVSSKQGPICTLVNAIASCPELEGLGDWDVKLNLDDHFKTDDQVNRHVQQIMEQAHPDLHTAFKHLIDRNDSMSFKYWESETLPEEMAYRYVCIPHIKGFWDHVLVGSRPPSKTETMIGPDENLPKLFNVRLGYVRFHWCCFVLQEQVILAMWCTLVPERGLPKVVPLVDTTLKPITSSKEFRNMVFFLARWFTVQYASQKERQLKVVLDCKPSEGSTLVHIIALLAYKSGMEKVNPQVVQRRARNNVNYHFNSSHTNDMFKCPYVQNSEGCYINIVDEFNSFNDHQEANGLTQIYTEQFF
ncbi:uncharacterized protein LOC114850818 isoform X2 [Betta splendens]|uniref:Uncharacterized protein LOC114850818 isoform X2 n=1 Tax=Betta splendens TaxID=158456 RepID=A0A9W2XLR6_BETSP|nr:uncharacterized protein LOC114850818 isoform X2 [Betta splendens]